MTGTCAAHYPVLLDGEPVECDQPRGHAGPHQQGGDDGVREWADQPECWTTSPVLAFWRMAAHGGVSCQLVRVLDVSETGLTVERINGTGEPFRAFRAELTRAVQGWKAAPAGMVAHYDSNGFHDGFYVEPIN
jgi:hypothetical protein